MDMTDGPPCRIPSLRVGNPTCLLLELAAASQLGWIAYLSLQIRQQEEKAKVAFETVL